MSIPIGFIIAEIEDLLFSPDFHFLFILPTYISFLLLQSHRVRTVVVSNNSFMILQILEIRHPVWTSLS